MCGARINSNSPLSANAFDGLSHHCNVGLFVGAELQEVLLEIGEGGHLR